MDKPPYYKDECTLKRSVVQKPKILVYRDVKKGDLVRYYVLHEWASECGVYTKTTAQA